MLNFVLVLLLATFSLLGCSSDSGSGNGNGNRGNLRQFGGVIADVNGTWFGRGSAVIDGKKFENTDFRVVISQIPARLNFRIDITSNAGLHFSTEVSKLQIQKNAVVTLQDGEVGSIGSLGFIFADITSDPQIKVKVDLSGSSLAIMGSYKSGASSVDFVGNVAK